VVVHAYNPSTQETKAEDREFKASLGYTVRPYLKKEARCLWPTPVILTTQEREIRRIAVQGQTKQKVPETPSLK
jgi:hypothetical protein